MFRFKRGLRAIKNCLNSSGRNLKALINQAGTNNKDAINQMNIFITSMNAQLKPKLVLEDDQLYNQLLNDVFGYSSEVDNSKKESSSSENDKVEQNQDFKKHIEQAFINLRLIRNDEQLNKVVELNEQIESRLGVAMIGNSAVGKSTIWRLLIETLRIEQQEKKGSKMFNFQIINPKSISRDQLLGYMDKDSNEWIDGIFSMKARELFLNSQNLNVKNFLIFDGDIDPNYIEALNSVLDDNQVYTMPTGERIDFDMSKISLLFETTSLKFASPATISRLGIICVSRIKCEYFLSKQLKELKVDKQFNLDDLARSLTQVPLEYKLSKCRSIITTIKYSLNNQLDLKRLSQTKFELEDLNTDDQSNSNFFITKSRSKTVKYCKMLMKENEHFILFGDKGSGKHHLLKHIGQLDNEFCLSIDCVAKLNTSQVLKKLKKYCTLVNQGMNKIIRSPTG